MVKYGQITQGWKNLWTSNYYETTKNLPPSLQWSSGSWNQEQSSKIMDLLKTLQAHKSAHLELVPWLNILLGSAVERQVAFECFFFVPPAHPGRIYDSKIYNCHYAKAGCQVAQRTLCPSIIFMVLLKDAAWFRMWEIQTHRPWFCGAVHCT